MHARFYLELVGHTVIHPPLLILCAVAFFHFIMIIPVDVVLTFVEGNLLRSGDIRGY